MNALPSHARVVIIGGGVIGCSVAYHLAKLGWTDIVLLERKQLTSGTTWHAAGLIAQLRATANMTRLAKYSQELYGRLEEETGLATGFKRNGSLTVALTDERLEELKRGASMARSFGVEIETISAAEAAALHPLLDIDGVVGAVALPKDGQGDPTNIALALAKGARQLGARIFEHTRVTGIAKDRGRVTGVTTDKSGKRYPTITVENKSKIHALLPQSIINLNAGSWSRQMAASEISEKVGIGLVQPGARRKFTLPIELPAGVQQVQATIDFKPKR